MEIVISGTKGGWGYFADKQPLGLFDIGAGAGIKAITQQAYGINYKNNNCIFTKYRIVKDVRGDKRIGFVAFSLFLPFDKKLSGKTIKTVLDKVESEYCKKYIPDGKNLEDVRENFNFLDTILNEYDKDIRSNSSFVSDDMQSGLTDAAFVYYPYVYKDVHMQKEIQFEIEDIFDAPFQEEYTPYRQILFISNDLKGKDENPLVALQHSDNDLTGKIDLKNEYYYLIDKQRKGMTITANDEPRSNGKKNNCIRAKYLIKIRYSENDKCYEPIQASGTLSDLTSEVFKYLEINGNQIKIKYDAFNNPTPKTKPVKFEIKDRNGKSIDGAEITYQTEYRKETTTSNTIHFTGEEIVKQWSVSAKKGDTYVSDKVDVYPDKQDTVEIRMHEIKKVEITAANENGIVYDFRVCIVAYNINEQTTSLEFRDETIEKECYIEVSKSEGYECYFGSMTFLPKSHDKIDIILTKREPDKQIYYDLDMGKHGSASAGYSNKEDGSDINVTETTKGYYFKNWRLDSSNKKDNCGGTLVAQYEKKTPFYKKKKIIAGSVIGLFVLGFSIWALCCYFYEDKKVDKTTITEYVEGDSLMLNKLNSDKENWERQKPEIKKEGGGIFGGEEKTDSTEYKEWDKVSQMINIAIKKRNMIDSKSFEELKNQSFSSSQQTFKDAINKIDSITSVEVGQKLGDISTLALKQITDKINNIFVQKESVIEEQQQEVKKDEKQITQKKENLQSVKPVEQSESKEQKSASLPAQKQSTSTDMIISYIKGRELDEAKLREYKETKDINQNLKNSIQLCLDFWALDGSGNGKNSKTYWTFRDKIKADNNFDNSNLKSFLDKICQEGANPSYSKQDKKKGLK